MASKLASKNREAHVPTKHFLSAAHRRKLVKALAKARRARWAKAKSNGIDEIVATR